MSVAVAAVAVIVAGVFIGHSMNPLWFPDAPTLVGQAALPAGNDIGAEEVTTAVPRDWRGDDDLIGLDIERSGHVIKVDWFDVVDGAIGDGKKERVGAAERDAQLSGRITSPVVHRKVAGFPAVELASTNDPTYWMTLHTYVFTPERVIRVSCDADSVELDPVLPSCATVIDHLKVSDD